MGRWIFIKFVRQVSAIAAEWAGFHERKILQHGEPLSFQEMQDAKAMGVNYPEKIRILRVDGIPLLNGQFIKSLSRCFPCIPTQTIGLSLRYGIYIRSGQRHERQLIAHECVHTGQYERCGSITNFLHAYFMECIEIGYPYGPLEQEAIVRSAEVNS